MATKACFPVALFAVKPLEYLLVHFSWIDEVRHSTVLVRDVSTQNLRASTFKFIEQSDIVWLSKTCCESQV